MTEMFVLMWDRDTEKHILGTILEEEDNKGKVIIEDMYGEILTKVLVRKYKEIKKDGKAYLLKPRSSRLTRAS